MLVFTEQKEQHPTLNQTQISAWRSRSQSRASRQSGATASKNTLHKQTEKWKTLDLGDHARCRLGGFKQLDEVCSKWSAFGNAGRRFVVAACVSKRLG